MRSEFSPFIRIFPSVHVAYLSCFYFICPKRQCIEEHFGFWSQVEGLRYTHTLRHHTPSEHAAITESSEANFAKAELYKYLNIQGFKKKNI